MTPPASDHYKNWIKKKKKDYIKTLESTQKQKPEKSLISGKKDKHNHQENWESAAPWPEGVPQPPGLKCENLGPFWPKVPEIRIQGYASKWKLKEEFLAMREPQK